MLRTGLQHCSDFGILEEYRYIFLTFYNKITEHFVHRNAGIAYDTSKYICITCKFVGFFLHF